MDNIKRGEMFYISRGGASYNGSEQHSDRPAVVVSNNKNNENSNVVEIVYMTTQPKTDLPTHVTVRSTGRISTVLCEQVYSVSTERVGTYIGECTDKEMENIDIALMISLQLDGGIKTTKEYNETIKEQQEETVDAETVEKMTTFKNDEDAAGQQEDAEDDENASNDAEATNPPSEPETGENGANTEPQDTEDEPEDKVIIPQGKMKVTVICDGSLNIRRSAAWGNENICGRAIRGQSYYVKEIHVVDGKKMVRTIGDLYLSGESEHVQFEQL